MTVRSMTGFGRAEHSAAGWRCAVELRSVNGRHLDLRLRLPSGLGHLQEPLKKAARGLFERGTLDGTVVLEALGEGAGVRVNTALLGQFAQVLKQAEQTLGRPVAVSLGDLLSAKDLVVLGGWDGQEDAIAQLVETTLLQACTGLAAMRETEGAALEQDLRTRVQAVRELLQGVEARVGELPSQAAAQIRERLAKLLDGALPNEERLLQEIALLADRSDVSEELSRVQTHLQHLDRLLDEGDAIGRKLDFLLQELNREVNTLSVKSSDS